jgi:hypothetical protein
MHEMTYETRSLYLENVAVLLAKKKLTEKK